MNIRTKKLLALLFVLAVVALGIIGALSVIPHVHGSDFDHSQHPACPIHQVALHGFNAVISSFQISFAAVAIFLIIAVIFRFLGDHSLRTELSRAPPTFA